jgi:hypothetical protein
MKPSFERAGGIWRAIASTSNGRVSALGETQKQAAANLQVLLLRVRVRAADAK